MTTEPLLHSSIFTLNPLMLSPARLIYPSLRSSSSKAARGVRKPIVTDESLVSAFTLHLGNTIQCRSIPGISASWALDLTLSLTWVPCGQICGGISVESFSIVLIRYFHGETAN